MPNRIIRPGINNSPRVNALGIAEELFFRRLFAVADDYGIFELDFDRLRLDLYALKRTEITAEDLKKWWEACISVDIVSQYEVQGQTYGVILNFKQQARLASQYPPPPADSGLVLCKSSSSAKLPLVWIQKAENSEEYQADINMISKEYWNNIKTISKEEQKEKRSKKEDRASVRKWNSVRAVAPSPNEVPVSPEIQAAAEEIRALHPRKRAQRDDVAAIANAIQRESEKSGETVQNVIERLKLATKQYAAAVSNWPPDKQCFIKSCKGWFDEGYYHENPEQWKQYVPPKRFDPRDPSTWKYRTIPGQSKKED